MKAEDIAALEARIQVESILLDNIRRETGRIVVGQETIVDRLLVCLLAQGHVLLEGMPGLAKTLVVKTLARTIDARFSRIQFTPDLLPADVVGTMVYNPGTQEFHAHQGPIFAHFVLADEINRAPAKVQSALLEAMQERQVTIGAETFALQEPFLVLATQNPVDQEGAYPLPEAQMDRFMLKVHIDYPAMEEEREIIRRNISGAALASPKPVARPEEILRVRDLARQIYMDEKIETYILQLVAATRHPESYGLAKLRPLLTYGASPRASVYLGIAARALAFLRHRAYVLPEDVRALCPDVLRHRIGLSYEAQADRITSDEIVRDILQAIPVPQNLVAM